MCEKVLEDLTTADGVLVDHVITSERIYAQAMDALRSRRLLWVHVNCPLEELLRREKARGNRYAGSAEASYTYLYPKDGYDLTVDTFAQTTAQCCEAVFGALTKGR